MKALVTGGTGFIGSHVVDLLVKHGYSVRLFSRQRHVPERWKNRNVSVFHGDLNDPASLLDAMDGMSIVYHIGEIRNTSRSAAEKNVRLIEWVVDELEQADIKRFVFVSSISVAGLPFKVPASEHTEPAVVLNDHYTWYKRTCEQILAKKAGALSVIVRPGMVYGSGSRYLGRMVSLVQRVGPVGLPFIGNGGHTAPFVHVADLASAIYLAGTRHEAAGQVFNITDGQDHTWFDFFKTIADASHRKFRIIPFPPLLMCAPSLVLDALFGLFGIKLSLNDYVKYLNADLHFDPAKAKTMLGWKPEQDFRHGVSEMVAAYNAQRCAQGQ